MTLYEVLAAEGGLIAACAQAQADGDPAGAEAAWKRLDRPQDRAVAGPPDP